MAAQIVPKPTPVLIFRLGLEVPPREIVPAAVLAARYAKAAVN